MAICILSFMVWLHHFFTMGAGADINGVFGIMSMIIAVPTGVKIFNWLFTMFGGRIRFSASMLWAVGFMVTWVIGGVLFGAFAGFNFWFPKAFGFILDERLGKAAFWCCFVGFYVAFLPLYVLGLSGMTRRMQHYDRPEWQPWLLIAGAGALIILCGIGLQIAQLVVSIRGHKERRYVTADPWDGRTLEWSTASPPPALHFALQPIVADREPY